MPDSGEGQLRRDRHLGESAVPPGDAAALPTEVAALPTDGSMLPIEAGVPTETDALPSDLGMLPTEELERLAFGVPEVPPAAPPEAPSSAAGQPPLRRRDRKRAQATPGARSYRAAIALGLAIVALIASFFFGWFLPLALIVVVLAVLALRRPGESRSLATWALALGLLATGFSIGWLVWLLVALAQMG